MANTRFKVDHGLNVVEDAEFFSNVTIARTTTTANLNVSSSLFIGSDNVASKLNIAYNTANNSANTVRVSQNGGSVLVRQLNFVNSSTLVVSVTDSGNGNADVSFTVTGGSQGVQGIQGPQGFQGVQGQIGPQGVLGAQGVVGAQGVQGAVGFSGISYDYSSLTSVPPSSGQFRFNNNTTFSSINRIYIHDVDKFGNTLTNYLLSFDDSTNTLKGQIVLREYSTGKYAIFNVTSLVDQTSYVELVVSSPVGQFFTNGNPCSVEFYRAGDVGPQGVQGVQGIIGAQGAQGVQGTAGTVGAQGVQGVLGAQGVQGIAGTNGAQGVQGTAGTVGAQGVQGQVGVQGIQGLAGTNGTNGPQGATGSAGPSNSIACSSSSATCYPVMVTDGTTQTPKYPSGVTISGGNTMNATDFVASSDKRFKIIKSKINNALANLKKVVGLTYSWNELAVSLGIATEKEKEQDNFGVIAQDVQEIFPELVDVGDNGYLRVNYVKLIPVMIEAIKELSDRVEKLEAERKN